MEGRTGPVLDVHPPHEAVHGWRDFLLHLFTITIGLLIALSLEGCVEWQHHRHLVHEAEASLQIEIRSNAASMKAAAADIRTEQENLKHDATVLKQLIKTGKLPKDGHMEIGFHIRTLESVSWKTAQSTGALAYMPYDMAQQYSDIYSNQEELATAEQQAARDAILSLAPFMNSSDSDPDPTPQQATAIKDHIEVLQGQLYLVSSMVSGLDGQYKKFLAEHP